jgi:ATP-dependent exoDNAse (exonuclease V) beta subunit
MLHPILKKQNKHPRDENIHFEEEGHKYTIKSDQDKDPSKPYTSVTTFIHSNFPVFESDRIIKNMMNGKSWKEGHKYWNMTADQIKNLWEKNASDVSALGTNLHYQIECFMNNPNLSPNYCHSQLLEKYYEISSETIPSKEWNYFINFITNFPNLKPYRTEWTIYHEELKLAGSIDMVYENPDLTLSIYDWKRVKNITTINTFNKYSFTECISHLPDSNFWHYTLQLNIYKKIIEEKYQKQVTELYLVRLHPENEEGTYDLIKIPVIEEDIIALFKERKNNLYKNA